MSAKNRKIQESPTADRKRVPYYRVSTDKQGRSGLGLEAQQALVREYISRFGGFVIAEFTEVESGKRNDRPELAKAIAAANRERATLVIAKLDRLARNTRFLLTVLEGGTDVAFCDLPSMPSGAMGKFLLTQMAAVAELEAGLISERTKAALEAYRVGRHVSKRIKGMHPDGVPADIANAVGGKLGASLPQCRNLTPDARKKGTANSAAARKEAAIEAVKDLIPDMVKWYSEGMRLRAIADRLNSKHQKTSGGSTWSPMAVKRVLDRARQP